jgi:hypothetical protein
MSKTFKNQTSTHRDMHRKLDRQFRTYMTPRDEGLSGQAKNRIDGK